MAPAPLSQLNPRSKQWSIRVLVSRRWHHRGGSDSGPIKHTDMVLIDSEGNCMYAEISALHAQDLMDKLEEGGVYDIKNILMFPNKSFYRPVEGPYMVRMTRFTRSIPVPGVVSEFPRCTYALTRLDNLPTPTDMPEHFTDVMGLFTSVSTVGEFYSVHRTEPTVKRIIEIKDLGNTKVKIVLWGETARRFDEEVVFDLANKGPVIAIFVGMLVKDYDDGRCLSGSAACRWYINEELPDIDAFYAKLEDESYPIERVVLDGQGPAAGSAQVNLETKTVSDLLALNPFENENKRFFCTATIRCITQDQRWWFNACTVCHRTSMPDGSNWRCTVKKCPGTRSHPRYKIPYIVTDGQQDAEFVFFDRVGAELIGKPLMTLLRNDQPARATAEEIIQFAMANPFVPRELVTPIGKKYRLVVSISNKVFTYEIKDLSFQVDRIDTEYGDNTSSSTLRSKTPFVGNLSKQPEVPSSSSTATPPQISADSEPTTPAVTPVPASDKDATTTPPSVTKPDKDQACKESTAKNLFPMVTADTSSGGADPNASNDKRAQADGGDESQLPLKKQKK